MNAKGAAVSATRAQRLRVVLPGILAAAALACVAWMVGERIAWLGGAGAGIVFGVVIASVAPLPAAWRPGLAFCGKRVLQLAIILLGAGLNLAAVWRTGVDTLFVMVATISAVFIAAWLLSRWTRVPGNTLDLLAAGTAICGGSAIAAVAPVIRAKDEEISYAISVVFLFNLAAVFLFPAAGHLLGLSPAVFGAWAGTAVNDTSSVMAAAYAYHPGSVEVAALVKMTRTVMIVPVALAFAAREWRRAGRDGAEAGGTFSWRKVFPWFVLGFLAMSLWATWGGLPAGAASGCRLAGKFLIVVALSAIGLNTNLRKLLAAGVRPILVGAVLWAVVALLGLALLY